MAGRALRAGAIALGAGILLAAPADAQILNTLRGFGTGPGRSGELGAFFSATGGNTENVSLTGSGAAQWQGSVHRWRLLLEGTRTRSGGSTTEEATAVHLRHNARLSERFASLAFVQHQYDQFQRLDARFLVGAGLRWDVVRGTRLQASVGASPMLEVERDGGRKPVARGRLSTFGTVLGRLDERTSIDLTAFVQPAMADVADTRAVGVASLRVEMAGGVALVVKGRLQYDTEPATGVDDADWKLTTGLTVAL